MDYVTLYCDGEYVDVPTKTYGVKLTFEKDIPVEVALRFAKSKLEHDLEEEGFSPLLNTLKYDQTLEFIRVCEKGIFDWKWMSVLYVKVKAFKVPPKDRKYKG